MGYIIVYALVFFTALAYMMVGTAQVFAIAAGLMRHHAPNWLAYSSAC